jgi:signal peptidase II
MRCPTRDSASRVKRKKKMASAVDPALHSSQELEPGSARRVFLLAALSTVVLDLITKLIAEATLLRTPGVSVFGDWFQLRLVYNQGAAFGLHVGPYSRWIFFTVALVAVVVLARMSRTSPAGDRFRQLALGLVAGGAIGNLIDRIRSARGVVDFLDVGIGALRWPTFNVADIAVSCGAIALAISLWREDARRPEPESASVM